MEKVLGFDSFLGFLESGKEIQKVFGFESFLGFLESGKGI